MVVVYNEEFGQIVERRYRFGGYPSWLQTVIREYKLGPLGPQHLCDREKCDCRMCGRYRWFQNPSCYCALRLRWGESTGLENAMRRKWLSCRCGPLIGSFSNEECCKCIMELPTQERVVTPESSYSLPSEFDGSDADDSDGYHRYKLQIMAEIDRIYKTLPQIGSTPSSNEGLSGETEIEVNDGTTEPIQTGSPEVVRLGGDLEEGHESDTEDTAASSSLGNKRQKLWNP
ncbi:hypothetical protein M758_6G107200 [Ceratodon purpureus]|nr:hypothetical protein M758_6G107200 [Ceratodon purpureus]